MRWPGVPKLKTSIARAEKRLQHIREALRRLEALPPRVGVADDDDAERAGRLGSDLAIPVAEAVEGHVRRLAAGVRLRRGGRDGAVHDQARGKFSDDERGRRADDEQEEPTKDGDHAHRRRD